MLHEHVERVSASDALVVLVGKKYGWVPGRDQGGDGRTRPPQIGERTQGIRAEVER